MKAIAPAILYALFVWWFSTGLVLLLVLRQRTTVRASLVGAALLFPICLIVLAKTSAQASVADVYIAFTAAILLWGTQEITFLTGFLTGPAPFPCPVGAVGATRLRHAIGSILYHEIALIASGLLVIVVTWGGANQIGTLTFAVLWAMRVSAKLNLFLGVPVLNDETMPAAIAFARSYFRRGPVNAFFPLSVMAAVLAGCGLVDAALDVETTRAAQIGYVLVAALMGLAIIEHVFMVVRLPIDKLWQWSTRGVAPHQASQDRRDRTYLDPVTADSVGEDRVAVSTRS
jgi:putative photosynthetic complex assembly protein 2